MLVMLFLFLSVTVLLLPLLNCAAWTTTTAPTSTNHRRHHHLYHHHHRLRWVSSIITTRTTPSSPPYCFRLLGSSLAASTSTGVLPEDYQDQGEIIIRQAAASCGFILPSSSEDVADETNNYLTIDWKGGKIVVTVHGTDWRLQNSETIVEQQQHDSDIVDDDDFDEGTDEEPGLGAFVEGLARAINVALDDGGIGQAIAERYGIEVTTPGVTDKDEFHGIMWEAYRGFDVIAKHRDPKKPEGKVKILEARLVERNEKFTVLNIKGRMKKLRNDMVVSVRLPKAKREKGAA